ncbi:MAG: STAS domain-containing protein [Treponema sp.]|nr:STAS domain-containing protein [Treponema sp.]
MDNELTVNMDIGTESVKFTIIGRIYSSNADIFEKHLEKALEEKIYNMVLNMSQVEYISSIGIRVILKKYMEVKKAGGKLEIEMPSEGVMNVLRITALDGMLVQPNNPGNI